MNTSNTQPILPPLSRTWLRALAWTLPLWLLLLASPGLMAAEVHAWFDRPEVTEGDQVVLNIEAEGGNRNLNPDLSPLNQDFRVLGTSTSSQVQIINGKTSAKTQLQVQLEPKHTGRIQVPALNVGSERTNPTTLNVRPLSAQARQRAESELFIKVEAVPTGPYVQAQTLLTVRLYSGLPLTEGSLEDPAPENAVVERLGEDKQYQTTLGKRRYTVIERRYAVFPQQSGDVDLPPIRFQGQVAEQRRSHRPSLPGSPFGGRDPFEMFNDPFFQGGFFGRTTRRVQAQSQPLTLHVRPRPATYSGKEWLPSQALQLREQWSEGEPRVGEPLTHTITLRARGLSASQLPAPAIPKIADARVYPDQPVTENYKDGGTVTGFLQQRVAIIPTRTGKLTIPETRLTWWDTEADKQRVAVLPAHSFDVLPALAGTMPPQPAPPAAATTQSDTATQQAPASTEQQQTSGSAAGTGKDTAPSPALPMLPTDFSRLFNRNNPWLWFSAAMSVLWLLTLIAWRRAAGRPLPTAVETSVQARPDPAPARRALHQSCQGNDPKAAAHALLDWANAQWPEHPPHNLGALAARMGTKGGPVRELDRVLYAPREGETWNGDTLWQTVKDGLANEERQPRRSDEDLAPLYPSRAEKS